jgi:hypothetical protein
MINLSETMIESPNFSGFQKFRALINPNVYLAENIADYSEEAQELEFPWYKLFPLPFKTFSNAYIIFRNVGLKKLKVEEGAQYNFLLHDSSGEFESFWPEKSPFHIPTFERAQEEQGMKEDDWAYRVIARYYMELDYSIIVDVQKRNFSNKKPAKKSLIERIEELLPEPELAPC